MRSGFPLLIAEVANCHGGKIGYLDELLERLVKTSVDAIKLQVIFADELFPPSHSQYKIFRSLEFSVDVWKKSIDFLKKKGKQTVLDIFGSRSLHLARRLNVDFIKIHATDFANLSLVKEVFKLGVPVFLSTGGAMESEIDEVMKLAKKQPVCLQVGFQAYPTPIAETHLNRIRILRTRYDCSIGLADHVRGDSLLAKVLPCLAVSMGAISVEKHVRLYNRETKYDWQSALSVEELEELRKILVDSIAALGNSDFNLTSAEENYRKKVRKQVVYSEALKKGEKLQAEKIQYLRGEISHNENPLDNKELEKFLKLPLKRNIRAYTIITKEMFK